MEEDNDVTVLGETQLGFHGIEFVLFRNGANRTLDALKANETDNEFTKINANVTGEEELVFAKVVALDASRQMLADGSGLERECSPGTQGPYGGTRICYNRQRR